MKRCLLLLPALGLILASTGRAQVDAATPTPAPACSAPPAADSAHPAGTPMDCCDAKTDGAPSRTTDSTESEKIVLGLEQRWCEAEANHDVAALDRFEADTFTFTGPDGRLTTKQDEIALAKQGGDKITYKLSDLKARVYGDAAILTGQTSFEGPAGAPADYRWTDVFVRQPNGEWRVVASQATAVLSGQAANEPRNK